MTGYRVCVVGATGAVGKEMLRVLEQRKFPVSELVPVASTAGRTVRFHGTDVPVRPLEPRVFEGAQLALFSAGSGPSREFAPIAESRGALVVDNSSAWRMDPAIPLVVPEVNIQTARSSTRRLIANPNCSTIQLVVAIAPIHRDVEIKRIVISTYQAVSGAGAKARESLEKQVADSAAGRSIGIYDLPGQLAGNLLMSWKPDGHSGYSEEEMKIIAETRKILAAPALRISPTTVRVPVANCHSESVTLECGRPTNAAHVRELLSRAPGVELVDDFANGIYPQPKDADGKDAVLVGRIRDDLGNPGGVQMWIVGDNLRKGAALNAVQIAEALLVQ